MNDDATSLPDLDTLEGKRLDRAACEKLLLDEGVGVLSLARDGEAYALPVSFGFDGEGACYFYLVGYAEPSQKKEFAAATARANLLIYRASGPDDWRSVIASGPVERLDKDEFEAAEEHTSANAWFPSLFSGADPQGSVEPWCLRVEELTGIASRE